MAPLIAAPASTKNREGKRDLEIHQSKKGNQWHFGMKAHIGVDAATGLVHSLVTTAANVHDVTQAHALLHGEQSTVFAMQVTLVRKSVRKTKTRRCNGKSLCGRANAKPYVAWRKTPHRCSACLGWPICCWPSDI
jgi:IS5 family transposase